MDINDRLRLIRADVNESQAKFCKRFNIPQQTYANYELSKRSIPDEVKSKIQQQLNVDLNWLITGEGSMYLNQKDISHETHLANITSWDDKELLSENNPRYNAKNKETDNDTTLLIPMTNMKLSAGKGWDWDSDESFTGEMLPVPMKIARRFDETHLIAATVKGDSMEPTLHDGEPVAYVREFENGDGIYALAILDEVYIKRLSIDKLKREITIISDNPKYPAKTYPMDQDGLQVLGKVVFWIHVE